MYHSACTSKRNLLHHCVALNRNPPPTLASSYQPTGIGLVLKLISPTGEEDWSHVLPGAWKAGRIESSYVLLTCHNVVHDFRATASEGSDWVLSPVLDSQKVIPLSNYVCGIVSCCGDSSFIGPTETALRTHSKISCDIGINFSLLFLKLNFEYQVKELSIQSVKIDLPLDMSKLVIDVNNLETTHKQAHEGFAVVVRDEKGATVLSPIKMSMSCPVLTSGSHINLENEVLQFDNFLKLRYEFLEEGSNSLLPLGSPIVFLKDVNSKPKEYCFVGIHLGNPSGESCIGLTLHGLFQLLRGGPVPCFSLLRNPHANRLWVFRWKCLILPYLRTAIIGVRRILEILQIIFKMKLLSLNVRDKMDTKISAFNITAALFHQFERYKPEEIHRERDQPCYEDLQIGIDELLKAIHECVIDAGTHSELRTDLAEACMECCGEILNFSSAAVSAKITQMLPHLKELETKLCSKVPPNNFQTHMITLYERLHNDLSNELASMHKKKESHVSKLEQHREALKVQQKSLEEEKKKSERALEESQRYKEQLQQCKEQLRHSQQSEQRVMDENEHLKGRKKEVKGALKEKQSQLEDCEDKLSQSEEQRKNLKERLFLSENQGQELKHTLSQVEEKLSQAEEQRKDLEAKLHLSEKQKQELEHTLSQEEQRKDSEEKFSQIEHKVKMKSKPEKSSYAEVASNTRSVVTQKPDSSKNSLGKSPGVTARNSGVAAKSPGATVRNSGVAAKSPGATPTKRPKANLEETPKKHRPRYNSLRK